MEYWPLNVPWMTNLLHGDKIDVKVLQKEIKKGFVNGI